MSLSHWTASVGAKGILNKSWVRVRNVPSDKGCDEKCGLCGFPTSPVGVTLEVDQETLHRPQYCRFVLGCRDIEKFPSEAKGVLGDYLHMLYYEL
jgi:hypothetical protein